MHELAFLEGYMAKQAKWNPKDSLEAIRRLLKDYPTIPIGKAGVMAEMRAKGLPISKMLPPRTEIRAFRKKQALVKPPKNRPYLGEQRDGFPRSGRWG